MKAGLAIDWTGREIIVPTHDEARRWTVPDSVHQAAKKFQQIPDPKSGKPKGKVISSGPCSATRTTRTRIRAVDSDPGAGTIHEKYEVCFDPHKAPPVSCRCRVPNLFDDAAAVHAMLAKWVAQHTARARIPCITLANLTLDADDKDADCGDDPIDITVRPLVYSNDLLFEMILGLLESSDDSTSSK